MLMKCQALFSLEKYFRMSSAAVAIGALRVNRVHGKLSCKILICYWVLCTQLLKFLTQN